MLYICTHISVAKSLQGPWKVCKCGWNFLPSVIICTYDFFRASKSEQQAGLLLMVLLITQAYGKINFSNNFIILVCRCKNWGGGGEGGMCPPPPPPPPGSNSPLPFSNCIDVQTQHRYCLPQKKSVGDESILTMFVICMPQCTGLWSITKISLHNEGICKRVNWATIFF